MKSNDSEAARALVAAAICDLLGHLANLEEPIIVGGQYGYGAMIDHLCRWCEARNLDLTNPDAMTWCYGTLSGAFAGSRDADNSA